MSRIAQSSPRRAAAHKSVPACVCSAPAAAPPASAFTVDLEDWGHGLLGGDTPITDRVVCNVDRVLDLPQRHDVRATFFALGKVCATHPQILPRVADAGHEIASHGYGHDPVYRLTPAQFRDDLRRSVDVIGEQVGGRRPLGYRAPQFSLTLETLWVGSVLQEQGFKYSSSIFPIRGRRYGIPEAPAYPFVWRDWLGRLPQDTALPSGTRNCDVIEFPMTTLAAAWRRWPVCGGGYLRLLPGPVVRYALARTRRHNQPSVLYMHPYELDRAEVWKLRGVLGLSRRRALGQAAFRSRVPARLEYLLRRMSFKPMREILGC